LPIKHNYLVGHKLYNKSLKALGLPLVVRMIVLHILQRAVFARTARVLRLLENDQDRTIQICRRQEWYS